MYIDAFCKTIILYIVCDILDLEWNFFTDDTLYVGDNDQKDA